MSIYATFWELQFPLRDGPNGESEWTTVLAQAVPDHIDSDGHGFYEAFLPPLRNSVANGIRAVVFVTLGAEKGTERSGQEYVSPLLMITGREYWSIPFVDLHRRIYDALRAGIENRETAVSKSQ